MILKKLKNLFVRNKPVFFIGAITIIVFFWLIFSATNRPSNTTILIEVGDEIIAPHTYVLGTAGSKITLVEFVDFGCEGNCSELHKTAVTLAQKYREHMRYGVRHYPLKEHKRAEDAAIAAQAAGEQGKFWEYADVLFEFPNKFTKDDLVRNADLLGLDTAKFENDIKSDEFKNIVKADIRFGETIEIKEVPTFFLNGKQINIKDPEDLNYALERALRELDINPEDVLTPEEKEVEKQKQEMIEDLHQILDETRGTFEISYDSERGFWPVNGRVNAGQLLKWTNNSEETILLEQLMNRFKELEDPIEIKPGESFEFRLKLRESGLWTYQEKTTETIARLQIIRLPDNIEKVLPKDIE